MPKTQPKKSANKTLLIVLAIVLVTTALAVFLLISKEENRDYRKLESYVGLTEAEATQKAESVGYEIRVVDRGDDGPGIGITSDFQKDRINFSLSDGRVVEAELY